MATRLFFNGREYSSPEGMPPDVRRLYEQTMAQLADKDGNQIPDILERVPESGNVVGIQQTSIIVNGQEFDSVEAMPTHVRKLYEAAMGQAQGAPVGFPTVTFQVTAGDSPANRRLVVEAGMGGIQLIAMLAGFLLISLLLWC